jgi:hypothetical protein
MKNLIYALAFSSLSILVGGCGGDDDDDVSVTSPPLETLTTAEGMWTGTTTDTNRTVSGFLLDDGYYWVLYSVANNSNIIAGAVQGRGISLNGSFTSIDGKDFNLEGLGILPATISGSYVPKQTFSGLINYPTLSQSAAFSATYNANYDITPSLTSLAGTYLGAGAVVGGTEAATLTITAAGVLTGSGVSGCQFSGTAIPRSKGNVFNLTITFGGGVCSNGTDTVTGIGYYDSALSRLWGTALNVARDNGFIYVGIKQ